MKRVMEGRVRCVKWLKKDSWIESENGGGGGGGGGEEW